MKALLGLKGILAVSIGYERLIAGCVPVAPLTAHAVKAAALALRAPDSAHRSIDVVQLNIII